MSKVYMFFILLSIKISAISQSEFKGNTIPPSPEASSLGRYVEIPVGHYTGVPEINIPLSSISQGQLSVPVSLSYHAGGHRVEDIAGWTGLGWTFNAGGVVTRVVRGLPDDKSSSVLMNFFELSSQYSYSFLTSGPSSRADILDYIKQGCADSEPDLFYFNFNGYTGKMSYDWNGNLLVSCSKPVKVSVLRDPAATVPARAKIIGWDIIAEDGTIYKFREIEETDVRPPSGSGFGCQSPHAHTSSWFLSEIADVNNENKIFLTYESYRLTYMQPLSWYRKNLINSDEVNIHDPISGIFDMYGLSLQVSGSCGGSSSTPVSSDNLKLTHYGVHLKKIATSSGSAELDEVAIFFKCTP